MNPTSTTGKQKVRGHRPRLHPPGQAPGCFRVGRFACPGAIEGPAPPVPGRGWRKWRPRPARRAVDPKPIATDKLLAARFESSNRLHYVSLIQSLCSPAGCLATLPEDRGLIVVDYGHLSPPGSVYVANHVLAVPLRTVLRLAAQAPEPSS